MGRNQSKPWAETVKRRSLLAPQKMGTAFEDHQQLECARLGVNILRPEEVESLCLKTPGIPGGFNDVVFATEKNRGPVSGLGLRLPKMPNMVSGIQNHLAKRRHVRWGRIV